MSAQESTVQIHPRARLIVYRDAPGDSPSWRLEILSQGSGEWSQVGDAFLSLETEFDDAVADAREHAKQMLAVIKASPGLDALFELAEVDTFEGYGVHLWRTNREGVAVFQLDDMAGRVLLYGDRCEIEKGLAEMAKTGGAL